MTYYLVMAIRPWESLELEPVNLQVPVRILPANDGTAGYVVAFETREKAEECADGKAEVVAVRLVSA